MEKFPLQRAHSLKWWDDAVNGAALSHKAQNVAIATYGDKVFARLVDDQPSVMQDLCDAFGVSRDDSAAPELDQLRQIFASDVKSEVKAQRLRAKPEKLKPHSQVIRMLRKRARFLLAVKPCYTASDNSTASKELMRRVDPHHGSLRQEEEAANMK